MSYVTRTEQSGVLTITLDRPEKRNAIDPVITEALWAGVNDLGARDDLKVMVIAARGPYFTAGIDLAHVPADRSDGKLASDRSYRWAYRKHHLLYDEFEAVEKPIVMAIQGPCLGAGVEMAASVDFRLASSDAYFRLPEIDLSVIPGSGGCGRLTRLVGPHWAKWLSIAGQPMDADAALVAGLVHSVSPPERFDEDVQRFVRHLASLPSEAVGLGKLVIDIAADVDRVTQRHVERIANSGLDGSEAFQAATARFRNPKAQIPRND
jgi:enoyl-CoA hydratase